MTQADPTHGEIWISVSKQVQNKTKTPAEILLLGFEKITNMKPSLYTLSLPLPPTYIIDKET